jgi:hypothetical protein
VAAARCGDNCEPNLQNFLMKMHGMAKFRPMLDQAYTKNDLEEFNDAFGGADNSASSPVQNGNARRMHDWSTHTAAATDPKRRLAGI